MSDRIAIAICYRDRPTEIFGLLQTLRTQTHKDFDIFIVDDASGTPIETYHFLMVLINKMNQEGNFIKYHKNEFNYGVSKSRQKNVEMILQEGDKYKYICRLDDDILLESDYIERLLKVIENGYDIASGVTPFIGQPQFKRESKFLNGIVNRVIIEKGEIVMNGDDCGMEYYDEATLPAHHFRSCALMKKEVHEKVTYENRLTKHGFREEQIFSFKAITEGFKIGVDLQAIAHHLLTPSGGERFPDSQNMIKINEDVFRKFTKKLFEEKGDFISDYNKKLGIVPPYPSDAELTKSTNLVNV